MLSLLDNFSRYNQILVSLSNQTKTRFRTKWGTYAYIKMPFGLISVGATFQWAMDITLCGLINKLVVVYLEDVTMFSKKRGDHLTNLWHIFDKFRKLEISLNPKKSIFVVIKGKLLGYVISKDGIVSDPKRIEVIATIPTLTIRRTCNISWQR